MKATVEADKCSSCGLCVETCPDVFEMDNDDIAKVKVDVVPPNCESCTKEAAENCPTEAIVVK
ncbi:MAG: ferredoxin [Planctomycetota bacterium]